MATSVANDIFGKEELLFAGVVTGTLEQYKDLLNSLGDVDVRGVKQRTLLYVAVGLGKVDWVEGLLEKGANPGLRDVEGVSVSELAKGMGEKYPEDEGRLSISKLVRLVMKVRDSVAQGGCNTTSTCQDAGMEAMGQDMISDLSRKMESMCESINDVHSRMDTLRKEVTTNRDLINDVKNEMATINTHAMQEISTIRNLINEEMTTNRDLINDVKTEMATINTHAMQEISTIRNSIDDVKTGMATVSTEREEIAAIRIFVDDVKTGITTINTHLQEMSTISNSIDDVKAGLAARDVLLSALETSVTSLANRERPVGMTPDTSTVDEEVLPSTPRTEGDIRRECVEAMMRKTNILRSDEGKVTEARGWYEKLYSEGVETACLFKFLKSHDDVSVVIDFDSRNIAGMRSTFRDHDGGKRKDYGYGYFADFEEKKVYLAVVYGNKDSTIGFLACALAQMSVCLAFNNGGRPYAAGDDVTERQMKNALKEAEEECRRNRWGLDWFIRDALGRKTQRGKDVYLTSAVPLIIARYGSTDGASLLQQQVPLLLELFRDSVMPALLAKAQV